MTSLEFQTIFDILNVSITEVKKSTNRTENTSIWKVYWNNFIISFYSYKYYAVVDGIIPMEVGNLIYSKYPGNPYKIRIEGGHEDFIPIDRGNDAFYTYHIDTKEGLLIFLTEMQDYLARKYGQPEIFVKQYPELLEFVSIRLIEKLNPFIFANDWMRKATKFREETIDSNQLYNETIAKTSKTEFDQKFRNILTLFDNCVNPFQGKNIDMIPWKEFISDVCIRGSIFDYHEGMKRENCMVMSLLNKNNADYVKSIRDPDGFYFTLDSGYCTKEDFYVIHYFVNRYSNEFDNGEILVLEHEKDGENILKIRYNLTLGLIQIDQQEPKAITKSQKRKIYKELLLAVKAAAKITMSSEKELDLKKLSLTK